MRFIGERLTQIEAKRFDVPLDAKLGPINSNSMIKTIKQGKGTINKKRMPLVIEYLYEVNYLLEKPKEQKLAELHITGEVVYDTEEKEAKKILHEWDKKRKIEPALLQMFMQAAINIAQIQAISIAKDMNLPCPIPLPKVVVKSEETKKK